MKYASCPNFIAMSIPEHDECLAPPQSSRHDGAAIHRPGDAVSEFFTGPLPLDVIGRDARTVQHFSKTESDAQSRMDGRAFMQYLHERNTPLAYGTMRDLHAYRMQRGDARSQTADGDSATNGARAILALAQAGVAEPKRQSRAADLLTRVILHIAPRCATPKVRD